ncbi:ribonuclease H-like domain-containing protein [Irpex lacteus]|nr:ribonuclease H-like domain-containing protein [Irpex lacteus]
MTTLPAESSSAPQQRQNQQRQNQQQHVQKPKVPERVYDLYSWRNLSPTSRLVYLQDPQAVDTELANLKPGPLGFDLEWKPTYLKGAPENPVAVVQLASEDTILLIQFDSLRLAVSGFPASLQALLENPSYSKAGVSILNDCKKLWKDYGVNVRNCIDLGLLARTVDNAHWKGKYSSPIGLARLCETYHELSLAKGKVQRSNWEANLSTLQQDYAANDCHSGLTLFNKLYPLIETIDPKPLPAFYSFDVFQGYPYQPSTAPLPMMLWQPHNPFYDPGPPPPPRPPKDTNKKDGESTSTPTETGTSTSTRDAAASTSNRDYRPRGRKHRPPPRTAPAPTSEAGSSNVLVHPHGYGFAPSQTNVQVQGSNPNPNSAGNSHNRYGHGGSRGRGVWRGGRGRDWPGGRGRDWPGGRGRGRGRGAGGYVPSSAPTAPAAESMQWS